MYRTHHTRKVVTSWMLTGVLTMGVAFGIVNAAGGLHPVSSAAASTSATAASTVAPSTASPTASTTKSVVTGYYDDGYFVSVSGSQHTGGDY
jgi:hypothetical protein